jgi:hypothetical protein
VAELKYHPFPKTGLEGTTTPGLATYSDLKQLTLLAVYFPLWSFPILADVLSGLENGNASAFLTASDLIDQFLLPSQDTDVLIKCIDGYGRSNYTTIEATRITSDFSIVKAIILERYGRTMPLESFADHSSFSYLGAWSSKVNLLPIQI